MSVLLIALQRSSTLVWSADMNIFLILNSLFIQFILNILHRQRSRFRHQWNNFIPIMRRKHKTTSLFQKRCIFFSSCKKVFFLFRPSVEKNFFRKTCSCIQSSQFFCPRSSCLFISSISTKNRVSPNRRTEKSRIFTMRHFLFQIFLSIKKAIKN